jgi:hypothetical protein
MASFVYKVEFEEAWSYDPSGWNSGSHGGGLYVLGNGDIESVIAKAKKWALSRSWKDDGIDSPKNKGKVHCCIKFRLIGVERICEIDVR